MEPGKGDPHDNHPDAPEVEEEEMASEPDTAYLNRNTVATKALTLIGLFFVWLPILAPFFFVIVGFVVMQQFLFDFLMPAELFFAALSGAVMLFFSAVRTGTRARLIGWTTGSAIAALIAAQLTAVATGLAHGETEPVGAPYIIALGLIILYDLLLIAIGISGILLITDLVKDSRKRTRESKPESETDREAAQTTDPE